MQIKLYLPYSISSEDTQLKGGFHREYWDHTVVVSTFPEHQFYSKKISEVLKKIKILLTRLLVFPEKGLHTYYRDL